MNISKALSSAGSSSYIRTRVRAIVETENGRRKKVTNEVFCVFKIVRTVVNDLLIIVVFLYGNIVILR
jgi:hypothetical protein